jgi:hypothetical protein
LAAFAAKMLPNSSSGNRVDPWETARLDFVEDGDWTYGRSLLSGMALSLSFNQPPNFVNIFNEFEWYTKHPLRGSESPRTQLLE